MDCSSAGVLVNHVGTELAPEKLVIYFQMQTKLQGKVVKKPQSLSLAALLRSCIEAKT